MREIEFRGKHTQINEWVYGFFFLDAYNNPRIVNGDRTYYIIPETVGQYTGLKDRKGVKIFEGDILIFNFTYRPRDKGKRKVVFEEGAFQAICNGGYMPLTRNFPNLNSETLDAEVVGNIHDAPELLNRKE